MLTLYIIINSVIIFESSLSGGPSGARSRVIALLFQDVINATAPEQTPTEIKAINVEFLTNLGDPLLPEENYHIPVGITRAITPRFYPQNTTDKSVNYTSSNAEILRVTQGGRFEARALGSVTVSMYVRSNDTTYSFPVVVENKKAPATYEITLKDRNIPLSSSVALDIKVPTNNGMKDAKTLKLHEYDLTKLAFFSEDETIATINKHGVISAHKVGTTTVGVIGDEASKQTVTVTNEAAVLADEIRISTFSTNTINHYVYEEKELIFEYLQNNTVLESTSLTDKSLTFVSSNENIANVFYDETTHTYKLNGTKLTGEVTISVFLNTNFITNAFLVPDLSFTVNVTELLPTTLILKTDRHEVAAGSKMRINATLANNDSSIPEGLVITNQEISYKSSDEAIATVSSDGTSGILLGHAKGVVTVTATSVANPSVTAEITITVTPALLINSGNFDSFHAFVRKAIGHFSLFLINGIIGYFVFLIFAKKEHIVVVLLSSAVGFFMAGISEFIQYFVPQRSGNFFDVLVNFCGYLLSTLLIFLVFSIIKWHKNRKTKHNLR